MKEFPFTMGADPELNILSQGRKVDACYTMNNLMKNDPMFSENKGLRVHGSGYFGWDGCSSTAELRPDPSNNPATLTEHIGNLFKAFIERINIFDFSVLSFHSSVGGHIHLQLPEINISDAKVKNMHKIIASYYLPLMMSENKININLRSKMGYGKINDYHGDNTFGIDENKVRTYEFRVPTAEWLTTPKICTAVFAYMATVWNEILNHPKNISKDLIYKNEKQGEALQSLLVSEYTLLTKGLFNDIKKSIKTFEYYPEYKNEIDYLFDIEKVLNDKKKANYDIIQGWNLLPENKFTKRDITNKTKFTELALKKDLDSVSSLFPISYNSDPNCEVFATDLARRAAAFNWKINKYYFLFGLRKGIDSFIARDWSDSYYAGAHLIKTKGDLNTIRPIFEKMRYRYDQAGSRRAIRLNFNTGTIERNYENVVFIGLPYEMRMKQSTNEFLKLVYDIENNNLPLVKESTLESTLDQNTNEMGAIWEIINKPTEAEVVMAKENTTLNAAIEEITVEAMTEERSLDPFAFNPSNE